MADAARLTADYEHWLGERIPLLADELDRKHAEMADDEFRFLRGSYYLWLARLGEHLPETLGGARGPAVGDLHVENFGTWRDRDGVRRWGVNDFDELAVGPLLPDLIRLATSAVIAPHVTLGDDEVCATVLETWSGAAPRRAIDLDEEGADHLHHLVPPYDDAHSFYTKLASGPPAELPAAVVAATIAVAEPGWAPSWHHHVAGTGSLGHRRVVGVGPALDGHPHAHEAKQLGPGTTQWAADRFAGPPWPVEEVGLYLRVRDAVAGPATATRAAGWQIRALAPDVVRIELSGLDEHRSARLLRSMAAATADVHGVDRDAFAAAVSDVDRFGEKVFRHAVRTMAALTREDHAAYRKKS
jgi:hypothetical protein